MLIEMEIVHIDMDMFFAAVEIHDNPELKGKPLIIGALPHERGVVATCSYEAREFGVRSAMSIKEAWRRCPHGVYMHPNGHKYVEASRQIHKIWDCYTDMAQYISLDEGFLDVTGSVKLFGGAEKIGREIKRRVWEETGLTCSVGIGYSMMSAKLASEEKKPDGFFQILTPEALRELIVDRGVRVIYGVGPQTEAELSKFGIRTVRDIYNNRDTMIRCLGNQGKHILDLADGIDNRIIAASAQTQSLGKEITFQQDKTDREYLKDVLRLIARELSFQIRLEGTFVRTVTLKVTFKDMKKITRSRSGGATNKADEIYHTAAALLNKVERRPIRLVGISLSGFSEGEVKQLSLFDDPKSVEESDKLDEVTIKLQRKYGLDIVKSGSEMMAEKRLDADRKETHLSRRHSCD
ncbi:MAG: DNA polymerase IV [Peptococcaceae bacterium]|nr:DNA polymerase IV [Peptococcaceae bacterium]